MRPTHLVTIQQPTETTSATGANVSTWSTFKQRWAEVLTSGGREFNAAQTQYGELTHLVKILGFCAVTEKMRVLMADGRTLEILAAYSGDGRAPAKSPIVTLACRESL